MTDSVKSAAEAAAYEAAERFDTGTRERPLPMNAARQSAFVSGAEWQREQDQVKLDSIRRLHFPVEIEPSDTICGECSMRLPNGKYFGRLEEWPCPTMQAIGESCD